jgi:hypothetical protein
MGFEACLVVEVGDTTKKNTDHETEFSNSLGEAICGLQIRAT